MKMTPEQRAFFEYGKAIEKMDSSRKRLKGIWNSSEDITRRIGKASIIEPRHKNNIAEAWYRRKVCKAWTTPSRERICENCYHEGTKPYATPCSECFRCPFAQAYEGFCDNWQPKV